MRVFAGRAGGPTVRGRGPDLESESRGRDRRTTLACVILCGILLSVSMFLVVRQQTAAQIAEILDAQAVHMTETIQRRVRVVEDTVRATSALFSASGTVTSGEFAGFIDHILPDRDGVDLLFWTPRTEGRIVARYAIGEPGSRWEDSPVERSSDLRGLASAALAGRPLAAGVVRDLEGTPAGTGYLLAVAVPTRRWENGAVDGAAVAIASLGGLFREAQGDQGTGMAPLSLRVFDPEQPDRPLYAREHQASLGLLALVGPVVRGTRIVIGDRVWIAEFRAVMLGLPPALAFAPAGVLLGGLVLTAMLAAYMVAAQRRAADVGALASRLERINRELEHRIRENERTAAALGESERKYREIYENAAEGIFQTSPDGRMLSANPSLARIYGHDTPADVLEALQDIRHQLYVDPRRRDQFARLLDRYDTIHGFESEVRRKDGSIIWISETARAVRDPAGRLLYYEGKVEDITDRRAAEELQRMAREEAELASRAKSEFLANMSHELRTPLNAVIGFSEIIMNEMFGPAGRPEYVEYARDIHESGTQLLALINDILDMSKIEAGKKELQDTVVDIGRVSRNCVRLVEARAQFGGVAVAIDLPPDLPPVRAEELALKQIIANLLTNAVKFTPKGGKVLVSAGIEPDGSLAVAVADTGIGIAPEDMEKALAPFGQIDSSLSNKTQGTGLGLPLARSLAALHGGTLSIESMPGRGTTVTVRLPAERVIRKVA
ncbi:PAS domain-containing sensor histidine kinase [Skermanella mucosa]|uniref:sensor histidine kinase n=1 Tax=Skermanella mucosa TaxID=1789672 RepID=UPI001E38515A|nr:PAS domain-containing sensor histidine kinase [Skermanella mucosa]UEM23957.1 PAS domain-containing sensor histidine kinase [Skermanella mucosa]